MKKRILRVAAGLVFLGTGWFLAFAFWKLMNSHLLPGRYLWALGGGALVILGILAIVALHKKTGTFLRISGMVVGLAMATVCWLGLGYLDHSLGFLKKISVTENGTGQAPELGAQALNIFIGGVDASDKLNDVNMIMTINPQTEKILLTGIPRDYYIPFHNTGVADKLTHSGAFIGADITNTMRTVADLMEIPLEYYIRVDFEAIKKLVDLLGGVDFYSDHSFRSTTMPKCSFTRGQNHKDGYCALAFSRERKSYGTGDLHRVENQGVILEAIMKKLANREFFLANYKKILDSAEAVLKTNLPAEVIAEFLQRQIDKNPNWTLMKTRLDGTHAFNIPSPALKGAKATMIMPNYDSVKAGRQKIRELMGE